MYVSTGKQKISKTRRANRAMSHIDFLCRISPSCRREQQAATACDPGGARGCRARTIASSWRAGLGTEGSQRLQLPAGGGRPTKSLLRPDWRDRTQLCARWEQRTGMEPAVDRLTTLGRSDSWRSPRRLGRGRWQEIWKADVCRIRLAPPAHFFQGLACDQSRRHACCLRNIVSAWPYREYSRAGGCCGRLRAARQWKNGPAGVLQIRLAPPAHFFQGLACDQSRRHACCLRNIVSAWPYREYSRAGGCCGRLRATRKWKNGPAGVLQNLWTAITPLALRAILAWCGHRPRLVASDPRYRATRGDPSGGGLRWAEGCLKSRPAVNSLCTDHQALPWLCVGNPGQQAMSAPVRCCSSALRSDARRSQLLRPLAGCGTSEKAACWPARPCVQELRVALRAIGASGGDATRGHLLSQDEIYGPKGLPAAPGSCWLQGGRERHFFLKFCAALAKIAAFCTFWHFGKT